ncbi:MAG: hypothetical protein WA220_01115, partial [Candidatus Nitrosopolaris sp.]
MKDCYIFLIKNDLNNLRGGEGASVRYINCFRKWIRELSSPTRHYHQKAKGDYNRISSRIRN